MTPEQLAEKVEKLPVWAQSHIRSLTREIESLTQQVAERDGKVGETDTVVVGWSNPDRPLPAGSAVRFKFPGRQGHWVEARLDKDGHVDLHGSRQLVIRPWVTNAVRVQVED